MKTWRYIVSVERHTYPTGETEETWGIRELYPDGDNFGYSENLMRPQGDSWLHLGEDMARMDQAFSRNEVLDLTVDPPVIRPRKEPRTP